MAGDDTNSGGVAGGTGAVLARAREAAGLSLADLAATTRIRERHLLALEQGDLAALPGRTYAVGFAKTFARAVGLNEAEIGAAIARDFSKLAPAADSDAAPAFTPGDPARVPSSGFAWGAGVAVLVIGVAAFFWWHNGASPASDLPSLLPQETQAAAPVASAAPSDSPSEAPSAAASEAAQPSGPVVFTAQIDKLWVKFYDGNGKQLLQKQLALGESYTVPADAVNPQVWTGRPEALSITIGGQPVPKLADVQKTLKNVPVSAAALLARGKPDPQASASPAAPIPGAAPVASASPAPVRKILRPRPKPLASESAPSAAPTAPSTAAQ